MRTKELGELARIYFEESYKYYVLYTDNSISDGEYDMICRKLLLEFDDIPVGYRTRLDKELLSAGSGYSIPREVYQSLADEGLISSLLETSEY